MDPLFHQIHLPNFLPKCIDHITSSPHYPKPNGYIKCQVKVIKTTLATASGKPLDKVLQNIRSTPIGPNLSSPRVILHNCTEERPGESSQPVNLEQTRNYLIGLKELQKENHKDTKQNHYLSYNQDSKYSS